MSDGNGQDQKTDGPVDPSAASTGWLPIETAPLDGTRILVWDGEDRWIVAWFNNFKKHREINSGPGWYLAVEDDVLDGGVEPIPVEPTHWAVLLPPPVDQQ